MTLTQIGVIGLKNVNSEWASNVFVGFLLH